MNGVSETSSQPPLALGGPGWLTNAPPWLNRLAHRLLTYLLGWALAAVIWIAVHGGDRHEMAQKFSLLNVIWTAAVYGVALLVSRVKRGKAQGSQ